MNPKLAILCRQDYHLNRLWYQRLPNGTPTLRLSGTVGAVSHTQAFFVRDNRLCLGDASPETPPVPLTRDDVAQIKRFLNREGLNFGLSNRAMEHIDRALVDVLDEMRDETTYPLKFLMWIPEAVPGRRCLTWNYSDPEAGVQDFTSRLGYKDYAPRFGYLCRFIVAHWDAFLGGPERTTA